MSIIRKSSNILKDLASVYAFQLTANLSGVLKKTIEINS